MEQSAPNMSLLLPVQLHIFLNARPFKIFQLRDQYAFRVAHLKHVLGASFHIPPNQIHFTLVSGRFTRDSDALFELRASDGNLASLDVGLSAPYANSSLSNGIISVQYYPNTPPPVLPPAASEHIQEAPIAAPTAPCPGEASSSRTPNAVITLPKDLTREQRIALRAQLEDPFSIASKSCFEDDSDEEDDYEDATSDAGSDVDDDLYSDDGQEPYASSVVDSDCSSAPTSPMSSPTDFSTSSSFWPSDPAKLTIGHLRQLVGIVPAREHRREVPLRTAHLRYMFQCRILERLEELSSRPLELSSPPRKSAPTHPPPPIPCIRVTPRTSTTIKSAPTVAPTAGPSTSRHHSRNIPHLVIPDSSLETETSSNINSSIVPSV